MIDGLWTLLPATTWRFGRAGMIRLRVLSPIDTRGLAPGDEDGLRAGVRRQMIRAIAGFRGLNRPRWTASNARCRRGGQLPG
ncbi:MAG: hypothetical protein U1F77_11625 [Kiritimatiellia bacterium]